MCRPLAPVVLLLVSGCASGPPAAPATDVAGEDLGPLPSEIFEPVFDSGHRAPRCPRSGMEKLSGGLDRLFDANCDVLSSGELALWADRRGLRLEGDRVLVVVHLEAEAPRLERGAAVRWGGVDVEVVSGVDRRVQGWVRLADLPFLVEAFQVRAVTVPIRPRTFVDSEGPAFVGAEPFHAGGFLGARTCVAVIDLGFAGYTSLLGSELPASVTAQSFESGGDIEAYTEHGTAVAEVVHDMVLDAALLLANYDSQETFGDAVAWALAEGAAVIVTSTGSSLIEPLDGRGYMSRTASATYDENDVLFAASAGNYGAGHYRATYAGYDSTPAYHDFGDTNVALLTSDPDGSSVTPFYRGYTWDLDVSLVWDDWGTDPDTPSSSEDYDLYLVYSYGSSWSILASSTDAQDGDAFPREQISGTISPTRDMYLGVVVEEVDTTGDQDFDLFIGGYASLYETFQEPGLSVIAPCVGADVLCVGATDLSDGIEYWSSQGPAHPDPETGTALAKPDLVAPDCVSTATYGTDGFCGTSAAAPLVAGAVGLYLDLFAGHTGPALEAIQANAVDLGDSGADDVYGLGRVALVCDDDDEDGYTTCEGDCGDTSAWIFPGRQSLGDNFWCTDFCPCPEGEGDCDEDEDCEVGLVCAQDVGALYGFEAWKDVCAPSCHGTRENGSYG
ncbi:MAG: S8 family serine peptidase, partial [Deltaproteobacteria bacterium]|nr:S8 family serine peptidase [Deltaproteobacteria bacterium]